MENLPAEILEIIFNELCLKDIGNCSNTCIRWRDMIAALFKDKGKDNLYRTVIFQTDYDDIKLFQKLHSAPEHPVFVNTLHLLGYTLA